MKKLFTLLLLFTVVIGNAQIRIGFSQKEIETELTYLNVSYQSGFDKSANNVPYTAYMNADGSQVIHYYIQDACVYAIIIPDSMINAIKIKLEYDTNYIATTDSTWMIKNIAASMHKYQDKFIFTYQ